MAEMKIKSLDLINSMVRIQCSGPAVDALTPEQQNALHVFKHEVLASMHRLYMTVPQGTAHAIFDKAMHKRLGKQKKD